MRLYSKEGPGAFCIRTDSRATGLIVCSNWFFGLEEGPLGPGVFIVVAGLWAGGWDPSPPASWAREGTALVALPEPARFDVWPRTLAVNVVRPSLFSWNSSLAH